MAPSLARVGLIDPLTLLGKEIRDRFGEEMGTAHDVRLIAAAPEAAGTLTEVAGAAAVVTTLGDRTEGALEDIDLAILCGAAEAVPGILAGLPRSATAIHFAAEEPGRPVVAGVNSAGDDPSVLLSPPAAVVALAHLAAALRPLQLVELTATAILPASDRGEDALQELFEQTRAIIGFTTQPPSPVFGRQLAFNLLPLDDAGTALEAALRAVLAGSPAVHLQAVQGNVFHGVSLSVALRFAADPDEEEIRAALAAHPPLEWFDDPSSLGPIDAARSEALLAGTLRRSSSDTQTYWLWAAIDNLTIGAAINSLRVARAVLGG